MGVIVLELPDLGSAARIERFYRTHGELLKLVILSVSVGFFFFLYFFGALVDRLRRLEGSGGLTWTAFAAL